MMQLKVGILGISATEVKRFQYLYGAVKSLENSYTCVDRGRFQYLYGAVKSIELQIASALAVAFQYLYGAVKRGVAVLQQAMSV
ncbi:hypothetical protein HMPREF9713_00443 [Myroides odoratimimus CCUG 12700]|nr:hypothetical protein HMPREF9713_00443 [Myroides odoratimimus CCUG 12700]